LKEKEPQINSHQRQNRHRREKNLGNLQMWGNTWGREKKEGHLHRQALCRKGRRKKKKEKKAFLQGGPSQPKRPRRKVAGVGLKNCSEPKEAPRSEEEREGAVAESKPGTATGRKNPRAERERPKPREKKKKKENTRGVPAECLPFVRPQKKRTTRTTHSRREKRTHLPPAEEKGKKGKKWTSSPVRTKRNESTN